MLAGTVDDNVPESTAYLAQYNLVALLELGLEATLREFKGHKDTGGTPQNYLAAWLMRHNPRHSKEGAAMLEAFMAIEREPLDDIGALEDRQREKSALQMQAAARGHAARVRRGEQIRATETIQACTRGRTVRREQKEQAKAAETMQAATRGRAVRKEQAEQAKAAEVMQAATRGRAARKEQAEQQEAATRVQASYRGKMARAEAGTPAAFEAGHEGEASADVADADVDEDAEQHEAATRVQSVYRGKSARAASAPSSRGANP